MAEAHDAPLSAKERDETPETQFGDPENKKYPLDTPEHVRAASSYVEKEHNSGGLSDAKYHEIVARVNKARKAHGIGEENQDAPETALDSRWERVQRIDLASGELGERKTTPQGGLVARANMTRTGVLEYRQPDGSVRRELRHPDEVFDPASLKTLAHATLTEDHPAKVDPQNWKKVAIGHVAGAPHRAGKFVQGDIHIQHGDAIAKAEAGKLQELSCGYECGIDPTPGTYEGQPYDAIQRNIRYNHVAAGPAGWGRAGSEVRMHLDGGASVSVEGAATAEKADDSARYVRAMPPTAEEIEKARLDAIKRADDEKARADKAEADLAKLRLDAQKQEGELTVLRAAQTTATAAQQAAEAAARSDASFDEQFEALEEARRWLGPKWDRRRQDGSRKSVGDIRREIVTKLQPQIKLDGLSDAIVQGMYIGAVAGADAAARGRREAAFASSPGMNLDGLPPAFLKNVKKKKGEGDDDDDDDKEDAKTKEAQDAMFARQKDAWKMGKRDRRNRDSGKNVPMRSAFGGGNQGNFSGGFGGGM